MHSDTETATTENVVTLPPLGDGDAEAGAAAPAGKKPKGSKKTGKQTSKHDPVIKAAESNGEATEKKNTKKAGPKKAAKSDAKKASAETKPAAKASGKEKSAAKKASAKTKSEAQKASAAKDKPVKNSKKAAPKKAAAAKKTAKADGTPKRPRGNPGTKAQTQVPVPWMKAIQRLAREEKLKPADVVRNAIQVYPKLGLKAAGLV
ncbi:MAG: hypothetical protein H0U59_12870 [Gemmatimonadaceae bacterium]|nr:hypothetical protein [Gemmatimonadaceae bacterium]